MKNHIPPTVTPEPCPVSTQSSLPTPGRASAIAVGPSPTVQPGLLVTQTQFRGFHSPVSWESEALWEEGLIMGRG